MQYLHTVKCKDYGVDDDNDDDNDDLIVYKSEIVELAYIFNIFNHLNLQLPDTDVTVIKANSEIFTFLNKRSYSRNNTSRRNLSLFQNLSKVENHVIHNSVLLNELLIDCDQSKSLHEDMIFR